MLEQRNKENRQKIRVSNKYMCKIRITQKTCKTYAKPKTPKKKWEKNGTRAMASASAPTCPGQGQPEGPPQGVA
jgi:hypothetical protein